MSEMSTAGAVPVLNEKGELSMKKVKVARYVTGKRPEYARHSSSEEESEEEKFTSSLRSNDDEDGMGKIFERCDLGRLEKSDPRLQRLMKIDSITYSTRRVEEPEVLEDEPGLQRGRGRRRHETESESEEEEDEDLEEAEMERRRAFLRLRALAKEEEELLEKEEEPECGNKESESEYEESTDSEYESEAKLKPVFVRKEERFTLKNSEESESKAEEEKIQRKREERRKETLKILEEAILKERAGAAGKDDEGTIPKITDVNTDEEDEDVEFAAWKIRELKRVKRTREERLAFEREQAELERLRNLSEEERRLEMKMKPKVITNKAPKGKYKFMQKYYHRGVFFLDKEEEVLKRNFAEPTLDDHFDKTVFPKVMQVKDFGRSGRTKYTHLVDQDTTNHDSGWACASTQNLRFHATKAGGVRQVFDKPSSSKQSKSSGNGS